MIDISVTGLIKSFDLEKKILDGITFQIDTGERVGLLGKNGAGKTTLFRILTEDALAPVDAAAQLAGEILFNIIKSCCCLCVPPLRLLINYNLPPRAASVLAVPGNAGKFFIVVWKCVLHDIK